MSIALGILFLIFSNIEIDFAGQELYYKLFISIKALPTTIRMELVEKSKFKIIGFSSNEKTFVVYIAALSFNPKIHSFYKT